jgi:ABC-type spermidine/putrescine transport system permease subunit I
VQTAQPLWPSPHGPSRGTQPTVVNKQAAQLTATRNTWPDAAQPDQDYASGVGIADLLIPFVVNDSLRAFSWSRVFSASGPIAAVFSYSFGGSPETYAFRYTTPALWFVLGVSILPFGVLAALPFVLARDDRRWQAALELDTTECVAGARTLLPMAMPGAVIGFVWRFVVAAFASAEERYVGNSTSMAKIVASVLDRNISETERPRPCHELF